MPKWYRLNTSGQWSPLKLYRLNTSGTWDIIKKAYRLNTSGGWDLVHTTQDVPVATTSPTLTNQVSSTTNFYGGDTLSLTRGAYTNTTANSDTTYRMTIYKGLNSSLSLNDTNWEVAARSNFTGANSTSSTSITYSLTDADAKLGYYLVGEVRVNNDANTAGSNNYDFETASRVLSRISFSVGTLTVDPTSYGGSFSWTVSGVADSTFIYDQTLVIRLLNSTGEIKKTESIAAGTTSVTISDSTNLSPSTTYYAEIQVTANDGWKTSATPNKLTSNTTFNTLSAPPVNTVAPTIGPLNNRTAPSGYIGYLPVSTTLTADKGTWSNTNINTTYAYNWFIEDSVTGSLQSTGFTGSTKTYSVGDVGDYIYVNAKATNSDGSFGTATSGSYILHQAVAVGTITPTSVIKDESNNFTFSISHYPTSYKINWGDNTTEYSSGAIAANTSTVNASVAHTYTSTGTYTITVTAQPGDKTNTASVTVAQAAPGPVRNLTRQLAALSNVATDKKFTWDAPNTGGSVSKYQFKINSGAWADVPGAGTQTFVELFNFNTGISNTVSIRAVGPGGNGSESSSGPFTLPIINTGPTASSISTSQATISWTSSNQNAYDLPISPTVSGYVSNAGLTSTTSRTPTGLSAGTSYTATLTITSSTSDTHTKSVTFTTLLAGLTPIFGSNSSTSDGFTGSVTNYDSNYTFVLTTNVGTVTPSAFSGTGTTKTFTVTGVTAGTTATVTVSTARTGYASGSASTSATALSAALTPTFGSNSSTSDGFTGSVTNYDSNYTFTLSTSSGTVTPTTFSGTGTTKTFTVTGVSAGSSATVTVTTTRSGYASGSASTSATALSAALTPTFGAVASGTGGFSGSVTNYDSNYTWNTPSVAAGTLTAGTWTWGTAPQTGSTRTFSVSGLSAGASSTATVTTNRTGYTQGSAQITGTASSNVAPDFTANITPSSGNVGTIFTASATNITGTPTPNTPTYQWQRFSTEINQWVNILNATSSTYTSVSAGSLRCSISVSNSVGTTTKTTATVTVTATPTPTPTTPTPTTPTPTTPTPTTPTPTTPTPTTPTPTTPTPTTPTPVTPTPVGNFDCAPGKTGCSGSFGSCANGASCGE